MNAFQKDPAGRKSFPWPEGGGGGPVLRGGERGGARFSRGSERGRHSEVTSGKRQEGYR